MRSGRSGSLRAVAAGDYSGELARMGAREPCEPLGQRSGRAVPPCCLAALLAAGCAASLNRESKRADREPEREREGERERGRERGPE